MHPSLASRAAAIGVAGFACLHPGAVATAAEWTSFAIGKLNSSGIFSTVIAHRPDGRFLLGAQGGLYTQKAWGGAAKTAFKNNGIAFDPSFVALKDDSTAMLGAGGFFGPSGVHPFNPSSIGTPPAASPVATLQNYVGVYWRHPTSGREGWLIGGGNGTGGAHNVTFVSLDGSHVGAVTGDLCTYSAGIAVDHEGSLYTALYELDGSPNADDADKVLKFTAADIDAAAAAVLGGTPAPVDRASASMVHQFSSASSIAVDAQHRVWATGWKISHLECHDPASGETRQITPDHAPIAGAAGPVSYQVAAFERQGLAYVSFLATDSWGTAGTSMIYGCKPLSELPVPMVEYAFDTDAQTVAEDAGRVQIGVTLSAPLQTRLTVPFAISGTATQGTSGDYTVSGSSTVVFEPGDTQKSISIQIRDDSKDEPLDDETVVLTLGMGTPGSQTAAPGSQRVFSLHITDNDVAPQIPAQSGDVIATLGSPVAVHPTVIGSSPLSFQWQKNRRSVAAQRQMDLNIAAASFPDAGRYRLRASNPAGTAFGPDADVIVIDGADQTVRVLAGRDAVIGFGFAGPTVTATWTKDGSPIQDGVDFTGTNTIRLRVRSATTADECIYQCHLQSSGGAAASSGSLRLVVTQAPLPMAPGSYDLPAGRVGTPYVHVFADFDSEIHIAPTRFSATGLPPGLHIDSQTGEIIGTPTASGVWSRIFISFSNIAGAAKLGPYRVDVSAYDVDALGSFVALVDRIGTVTGSPQDEGLGARLDLTTTRSAAFTGRLTLGSRSLPFKGVLDTSGADPAGVATIKHSTTESLALRFSLNATTGKLTGTLNDATTTAGIQGWHAVSAGDAAITARRGVHNFFADIPGGPPSIAVPEGTSFGTILVPASGRASVTGKAADGSTFTTSAPMGTAGEVLLYQALYRGAGSLTGHMKIESDSTHSMVGDITWSRPPQTSSHVYAVGWSPPLVLQASGGVYTVPFSGAIVMNLPATTPGINNARLDFDGGGVGTSPGDSATDPDIDVRITSPAKVSAIAPNPNAVQLSITVSTGAFRGAFTLTDGAIKRRVTFQGLVVPDLSTFDPFDAKGHGWFLLPGLPGSSASAKRSGAVMLSPLSP